MASQHSSYVEKFQTLREKVDSQRKRSRSDQNKLLSGCGAKQPKLEFGPDNSVKVEKSSDPALQSRYDEAKVIYAARTMSSFQSLEQIHVIAEALLPNTHKQKLKNKSAKAMSRKTGKMANLMKRKLFNIVLGAKKLNKAISLTSDMWKSRNNNSVIGLTAHFFAKKFKLQKFVLYAEYFGQKKHTGRHILIGLNKMMAQVGLHQSGHKKYILLDNASNNKCAMKMSNDFVPVWCAIHTLQLSISDSFKAKVGMVSVKKIIEKCKEVSNLVRRAEANRDDLKRACAATNTDFILPFKPGETRWNSKEKNLCSVIRLQPALQNLQIQDTGDTWSVQVPTAREFETGKAMQQCLEPLKIATKIWEQDKKPTIHTVVRELFNIKVKLGKLSRKPGVKMFAKNLQYNVEKRFRNCGTEQMFYNLGHFLDPSMKGEVLKQFPGVFEKTLAEVKRRCLEIEAASVEATTEDNRAEVIEEEVEEEEELTGAQLLMKRAAVSVSNVSVRADSSVSKAEVEVEKFLELAVSQEDICIWWEKNMEAFPILSQLAREILSIPASSASSERLFSAGTRVGQTILCIKNPNNPILFIFRL